MDPFSWENTVGGSAETWYTPTELNVPCLQAQSKAADEGKSTLPGVTFSKMRGIWTVRPLTRWGDEPRHVHWVAGSRVEAEAIQEKFFPRLEAAAAEGRFGEEFAAVKAEIRAKVRGACDILQ